MQLSTFRSPNTGQMRRYAEIKPIQLTTKTQPHDSSRTRCLRKQVNRQNVSKDWIFEGVSDVRNLLIISTPTTKVSCFPLFIVIFCFCLKLLCSISFFSECFAFVFAKLWNLNASNPSTLWCFCSVMLKKHLHSRWKRLYFHKGSNSECLQLERSKAFIYCIVLSVSFQCLRSFLFACLFDCLVWTSEPGSSLLTGTRQT